MIATADFTLSPLEPLCLRQARQVWARHHELGIEYFGYTAAGTTRHDNEDSFIVEDCGDVGMLFGVLDEATQKIGIRSREALSVVVECLGAQGPDLPMASRLAMASDSLNGYLSAISPPARAGVCAILAQVEPKGIVRWAGVGDCSAHVFRADRWWRRSGARRLNVAQRTVRGQLTHALGSAQTPRVEQGWLRLRPGDLLVLSSDGLLHEALDSSEAWAWISGHRANSGASLCDLARKLVAEGRLAQQRADDVSLVVIERQTRQGA